MIVADVTPPVLSCPDYDVISSLAVTQVNYPSPIVTDNRGLTGISLIRTAGLASGSNFQLVIARSLLHEL